MSPRLVSLRALVCGSAGDTRRYDKTPDCRVYASEPMFSCQLGWVLRCQVSNGFGNMYFLCDWKTPKALFERGANGDK